MNRMKNKKLMLSAAEYEHFSVTLEGVVSELEELSDQLEWYVSALPERAQTCLEILRRAK